MVNHIETFSVTAVAGAASASTIPVCTGFLSALSITAETGTTTFDFTLKDGSGVTVYGPEAGVGSFVDNPNMATFGPYTAYISSASVDEDFTIILTFFELTGRGTTINVADVSDEVIEDVTGAAWEDSTTIDVTYTDATGKISAALINPIPGDRTIEGDLTLGKNGAVGANEGQINLRDGANPGTSNNITYTKWKDLEATSGLMKCNGSGDYSSATVTESSGALGAVTTIDMSGVLTNTLADGTAPMTITSTTKVSNLNVDRVDGFDFAYDSDFTSLTATV